MRGCVLSLTVVAAHLLREDPSEHALLRVLQLGHAEPLQASARRAGVFTQSKLTARSRNTVTTFFRSTETTRRPLY